MQQSPGVAAFGGYPGIDWFERDTTTMMGLRHVFFAARFQNRFAVNPNISHLRLNE